MATDKDFIFLKKMVYNPDVYDATDNYCTLSPDTIFGVTINYACYLHDRQYRNEVKIRKTRKQADLDFRDEIYKIFKNSEVRFKKIKGWIVSRIYYFAVARVFPLFKDTWVKEK